MFHGNPPKRVARTKGSLKLKTKEDTNINGPSIATPAKNLQNPQIPSVAEALVELMEHLVPLFMHFFPPLYDGFHTAANYVSWK